MKTSVRRAQFLHIGSMYLSRVNRSTVLFNRYLKAAVLSRTSTTSANIDDSHQLNAKPLSEIPPTGKYDIPYIGTMLHFKPFTKNGVTDQTQFIPYLTDKYGDIYKIRMKDNYMVVLSHAEDARTVLQANYVEHKRMGMDISRVASERMKYIKGIDQLNGKEWAERRKPAQEKMLRPAVVASYVPLLERVTNDFVHRLRQNPKTDDLLEELLNYSAESVGMLCFNRRLGCLESGTQNPAITAIRNLFEMFQQSFTKQSYKYFRTKFYRRFEAEGRKFAEVTFKEIASQKEFLKNLEKEGKLEEYLRDEPNFMYSLLADPRVNDEEANSIIGSLFGAGIETTANTMVFLLADLAMNQDKQEKLYEEIKRVVGDSQVLTKEHIAQMSYLKACLKESHRKTFPTSLGVIRYLESDMVIRGYLLPKDTLVALNMRHMSLDDRFFPRPTEFIPERWLRETTGELAKGKQFPFATKPFGFGPRACLGQRFAENEIFIGTTKIIQNFQISMPPGVSNVKIQYKLFTTPAEKVEMYFKSRQNA